MDRSKMPFATDLHSPAGKDGLQNHIGVEINTLNALKDFLQIRIKIEKKFLEQMRSTAKHARESFEKLKPDAQSGIYDACRAFVDHYDGVATRCADRNESMSELIYGELASLIQEKESLKADFQQRCRSIEADLEKSAKEVKSRRQDYDKACTILKAAEDKKSKGEKSNSSKLEKLVTDRDSKEKLMICAHNEYVLAIAHNNSLQESNKDSVLPGVLTTVENLQRFYVVDTKVMLEKLSHQIDVANTDEQDAIKHVRDISDAINPDAEYESVCVHYKSSPEDSVTYSEFSPSDAPCVQNSNRPELISGEISIEGVDSELELNVDHANSEGIAKSDQADTKNEAIERITDANGNRMKELDNSLTDHEERLEETKKYKLLRSHVGEKIMFEAESSAYKKRAEIIQKAIGGGHGGDKKAQTDTLTLPLARGDDDTDPNSMLLADQLWWHGVLPKPKIAELLQEPGDFLVREKTKYPPLVLVLSVHNPNSNKKVSHFPLTEDNGIYSFEGPQFNSVRELIDHYVETGEVITQRSQCVIKRGVVRRERPIAHEDIHLGTRLGKGNFGDVYKGEFIKDGTPCAIKTCKENVTNPERFLEEADTLNQYRHPNIVQIFGVVKRTPIWIVLELCQGGELLQYLRTPGVSVTLLVKTRWAKEAASGIAYLHEKNCIHRDLAARNCLLTGGDPNVLKISDFGMSRIAEDDEDVYTASTTAKQIPIRWTAPEALEHLEYYTSTDVWGYGVMIWEILSGGKLPYAGYSNAQCRLEVVQNGRRLDCPSDCPTELFAVLESCWMHEKDDRPTMPEVESRMTVFVDQYEKEAADQEA